MHVSIYYYYQNVITATTSIIIYYVTPPPTDGDAQGLKPLVSIMAKAGVYAYFSGHAHSLQHIEKNLIVSTEGKRKTPVHWHQFVSGGGGGYLLPTKRPVHRDYVQVRYAKNQRGFLAVDFLSDIMRVTFVDDQGNRVHSVEISCNSVS